MSKLELNLKTKYYYFNTKIKFGKRDLQRVLFHLIFPTEEILIVGTEGNILDLIFQNGNKGESEHHEQSLSKILPCLIEAEDTYYLKTVAAKRNCQH